MKTLYIVFIALSSLTLTNYSTAQTAILPNASIESNQFILENETVAISSVFTKTDTTLTWVQTSNSGTSQTIFSITEETGTWDSGTSIGMITLTLQAQGVTSTITLTGTGDDVTLQMQTIGFDNTAEVLDFNVTQFSYL